VRTRALRVAAATCRVRANAGTPARAWLSELGWCDHALLHALTAPSCCGIASVLVFRSHRVVQGTMC
jgi:hypothetical protein